MKYKSRRCSRCTGNGVTSKTTRKQKAITTSQFCIFLQFRPSDGRTTTELLPPHAPHEKNEIPAQVGYTAFKRRLQRKQGRGDTLESKKKIKERRRPRQCGRTGDRSDRDGIRRRHVERHLPVETGTMPASRAGAVTARVADSERQRGVSSAHRTDVLRPRFLPESRKRLTPRRGQPTRKSRGQRNRSVTFPFSRCRRQRPFKRRVKPEKGVITRRGLTRRTTWADEYVPRRCALPPNGKDSLDAEAVRASRHGSLVRRGRRQTRPHRGRHQISGSDSLPAPECDGPFRSAAASATEAPVASHCCAHQNSRVVERQRGKPGKVRIPFFGGPAYTAPRSFNRLPASSPRVGVASMQGRGDRSENSEAMACFVIFPDHI